MEIPVTFGIDPIVTGSAGDFSWNISAFWMVVHSLGREDGDYVNWKIVGEPERRESAQTILRAFGVSYEGQRIPRIRFEIEYSTSGQAGRSGEVEVCIYDWVYCVLNIIGAREVISAGPF